MAKDFWYPSGSGCCQIHGLRWEPEGEPRAVVQIVHGIADFARRYEAFARYLTGRGFLVVAQDHMGHGESINGEGIRGYFHGGWFQAAEDVYRLLTDTRREFPHTPYILFGHSMGSFLARTLLITHPDSGISGAVLCGTAWQPSAAMPVIVKMMEGLEGLLGEKTERAWVQNLAFGTYNRRVEHPRTAFDWISRDREVVDAYAAHPLCGFTATVGLLTEMMKGIAFIQKKENLGKMEKDLPVLFIAGGDDPVGNYGTGVRQAAQEFKKTGMARVDVKLYPLGRHEILNELNRQEVFQDLGDWLEEHI